MKFTHSLLCLLVVLSSALSEDTVVNPRGARPIEHGYKAQDTCQTKEWPMCTDEDWGSKCPSGCRVQGLLDKTDHDLVKKIEKIRRLLDEGRKLYRSADQVSKTTYSYLRERLTLDAGNDNRYATLAEQLRQRISEIKIKIDRQLRLLYTLKSQVKDQVVAMQRLEVDIDMKLRACKGSCSSYNEFSVDRDSYVSIDKQMDNLNSMGVQNVETFSSLGVMKSRPLKDDLLPSIYKAGAGPGKSEQKLIFEDVGQLQLSLEAEGSTAESAATVSKFPTVCKALQHSLRQQPNRYGYSRFEPCPIQPTYPLCSDDEVDDKCPSGCRLEGLIDAADENIHKHLTRICEKIQQNEDIASSVMRESVRVYGSQRRAIIQTYMQELRYAEFAEELHRNLTFLHKRSAELTKELQKHHHLLWTQINEMRRLEVDIDIKIRVCKGSCKQTFDHAVDNQEFQAMENKMAEFSIITKRRKSFSINQKLKLKSVDRPSVSPTYRKIPVVRTELLTKFEDIEQRQVVLEECLDDI